MKQLRISDELALPIDVVTETIALLAKRGAGKTYAASVLVEEMLEAKLQVVVLDPMGAWYGLRSSVDGKSPGYPIAILGGEHADVPLEPAGGHLAADLVVDERLSAIIDLSAFSKNEWRRFVADFLGRLYNRNRDAMHVVLEEADLFAPEGKLQRAGDEQMLGAVYDLVRRGRGRGIGSTLITQRSASISKEVLTQAEILIALRTTGPHDRKAIELWIEVHGEQEERDRVTNSLPSLPTGTAWVWWPVEGILRHVAIRERRTFDSSATPKPGESRRQPKTVADVDLEALRERMAATIERAKADDPRELRRRLGELEKKRRQLQGVVTVLEKLQEDREPERIVETVEVPVLDGHVDELEAAIAAMRDVAGDVLSAGEAVRAGAEAIAEAIMHWRQRDLERPRAEQGERKRAATAGTLRAPVPGRAPARRPVPPAAERDDVVLGGGERKILDSLASHHPTRVTRSQLGTLSGYSHRGGTFGKYFGILKREGLLLEAGGEISVTDAGLAYLGFATPDPKSPDELLEMWRGALEGGPRKLLDELVDAYPSALTREELGERTEYEASGGTFGKYLGILRRNELVTVVGHEVRASDTLFMGALV